MQVTSHAAELHALQEANTELQSKLNMAELLTKQLSAESPPPVLHGNSSSNQLDELHAETERLEGLVRSVRAERDQALSDLDALRDAMFQQQQSTSGKVRDACMGETPILSFYSSLSPSLLPPLAPVLLFFPIFLFCIPPLPQMAELHSRLAESDAERLSLSEQLQEMRRKEGSL